MIVSTARQSVVIKCNMQASALLSNYEFYYAAGLFCNLNQIAVREDLLPKELEAWIAPKLKDSATEDERERHLTKMLLQYRALENYDAQMKELLQWGISEEKIWQINGN